MVLPHINDFPAEILREIFLCVVSDSKIADWDYTLVHFSSASSSPYTANYRSPASPYSSSHVCRKWRDIALSFPLLWTHLFVVRAKREDLALLTQQWLDRAGSKPLYLFLHEASYTKFATKAVLKSFIKHMHKWKSFQMKTLTELDNFVEPDDMHTFASPALEHLILRSFGSTGTTPTLFNILVRSPALRSVTLASSALSKQFKDSWAPKWGNIKELNLCAMTHQLDELVDGLSHCRNLQRLGIEGIVYWRDGPGQQLTLPGLTRFAVRADWSIVARFILPSLSILVLSTFGSVLWSEIISLLHRSRVSPKVLMVKTDSIREPFSEEDFLLALRDPHFQRLKVLEVERVLSVQTVKFLTHPTDKQGLKGFVPHLERLSITFLVSPGSDHFFEVEQLIESRLGASSSITARSCLQDSRTGFAELTLNIPPANCHSPILDCTDF